MGHPLLCWDICAEGIYRRTLLAKDLEILQKISADQHWNESNVLPGNALVWGNKVIIITDSNLSIIHVTENMFAMNGYMKEEVVGKTPGMFQGAKTEIVEKKKIRAAIDKQIAFESIITNYKKDGSLYKCRIEGYPVFNTHGHLVNFMAFENTA